MKRYLISPGWSCLALAGAFSGMMAQTAVAQQPSEAALIGIPMKPDPPPAINGDLAEWAEVPNAIQLNRKEQVVFGEGQWNSPEDLSATIHLAWRNEYLFVAANVTDEQLRQTQRGGALWKGDHLELYIDVAPDNEPQRTTLGKGQFQIGLSPGNFQNTGDALNDLKPEAYVFRPENVAPEGILVAAQRTEKGYAIEAAIPWKLLGVTPQNGTPISIEVGVSDTDGNESRQENLMTIGTARWERSRSRWQSAALAGTDGKAVLQARSVEAFGETTVPKNQKREVKFEAPAIPAGRDAVLVLNARLQTPKVGGYTRGLKLALNGKPLDVSRLLNKKNEVTMSGKEFSPANGDAFVVPYAPDFKSADTSTSYGLSKSKLSEFALKVTDVLQTGTNTLVIENAVGPTVTYDLVAGEGKIEFRVPEVEIPKRPAPAGPIPLYVPQTNPVKFQSRTGENGQLTLSVNGETFTVQSQFSAPDAQWVNGSSKYFDHKREVQKRDEWLIVRDTFTNKTKENLPIMQRHRIAMPLQKVWLAGISPATKIGTSAEASNPTTFGITQKSGVGLMPLDDVSQVHTNNHSDGESIGLADNHFVLKPSATHTAEWAIIPTSTPDYYAFVNAARRLRDVNFPIDGGFAFLRVSPKLVGGWSDEQIVNFFDYKNAKYTSISIGYPGFKGRAAHGTAFQQMDLSTWKEAIARRRKLVPHVKQTAYYHSFLDASEDPALRFPDARLLRSDGTQGDYGQSFYKLFVPTKENEFGRATRKNVDIILDDLKLDGVYWDEIEYSAYKDHYEDFSTPEGLPWDGVSADIDPKTMKITRLKSSVSLISQEWRVDLAKYILKRGVLIGNGAPATRTMMQVHFPRFVETGSISNCARAQLYTPIALGDHLTERSELDAYKWMLRALDYGCVYYWYNDLTVPVSHRTLTSYMFPITPVELHEGFIIGKERIITNRSGVYGWNDKAKHEIHVFDDLGREVKEVKAPVVAKSYDRDGKTFSELRLPEDWSAAIVRR